MKQHGKAVRVIRIVILTVLIAAAAAGTGATLAYLTDSDRADNPFTVGETEIEIRETFSPDGDVPEPGEGIPKVVRIVNTGELTCLIRVRLLFEDDTLEKVVEPFVTGHGWEARADGFYYYIYPVRPGGSTVPLIEEVRIRSVFENGGDVGSNDLKKISSGIIVYSEAIGYRGDPALPCTAAELEALWGEF